jgi:hypothetical protein
MATIKIWACARLTHHVMRWQSSASFTPIQRFALACWLSETVAVGILQRAQFQEGIPVLYCNQQLLQYHILLCTSCSPWPHTLRYESGHRSDLIWMGRSDAVLRCAIATCQSLAIWMMWYSTPAGEHRHFTQIFEKKDLRKHAPRQGSIQASRRARKIRIPTMSAQDVEA